MLAITETWLNDNTLELTNFTAHRMDCNPCNEEVECDNWCWSGSEVVQEHIEWLCVSLYPLYLPW